MKLIDFERWREAERRRAAQRGARMTEEAEAAFAALVSVARRDRPESVSPDVREKEQAMKDGREITPQAVMFYGMDAGEYVQPGVWVRLNKAAGVLQAQELCLIREVVDRLEMGVLALVSPATTEELMERSIRLKRA